MAPGDFGPAFYQFQRDAWGGRAGRWVQPPGWRPHRDEEIVRATWHREGVTWSLDGRWGAVREALIGLGMLAP